TGSHAGKGFRPAGAVGYPLNGVALERDSAERLAQAQVILAAERFGAGGPIEPEAGKDLINMLFVVIASRHAHDGAAQVLAAMRIEVAQEDAEALQVGERGALGGSRPDAHDPRLDLGPGPEDGRRQAAQDL